MTHAEFVARMQAKVIASRPKEIPAGLVAVPTRGSLGEIHVTPETAREIDPNYCSVCTPKGLGYCRCQIASNE